MLFNEKQMLDVCKKYGIDVIQKDGFPLYQGVEMDENFSVDEIMYETSSFVGSGNVIFQEMVSIPVFFESQEMYNYITTECTMQINLPKADKETVRMTSSILSSNPNKYAA